MLTANIPIVFIAKPYQCALWNFSHFIRITEP